MNWRCRIGWHDWEPRVIGYLKGRIREDYMRCTRPGCRYADWMLVNRERVPR